MQHPSDGTLRRFHDDPVAIPLPQRSHIGSCFRCQERMAVIRTDASYAAAHLSGAEPSVNTGLALAQVQARLASEAASGARSGMRARMRLRFERLTAPLTATAAGLAILAGFTLTPAGSLAQHTLQVFQPAQIAAVPVTNADLRSVAQLRALGTLRVSHTGNAQTVSSPAQASALSGMTVLTPTSLPSGVPTNVRYGVVQPQTGTFTFSAARARAVAARTGKPLPAMPGDMDGSVLQVRTGSAVLALYGAGGDIPALAIGQMRAPVVSSRGASVAEMEQYIIHLPGVSKGLAASLQALGDPTQFNTLPIPVPINMAMSQPVQVQGVQGLAVGDSTGVGSVVVWEKAGIIYGVGGSMTESEALTVANSLK